jgi:opacity protein-like surface antigen
MKKGFLFFAILLVFCIPTSQAQDNTDKNKSILNLGVGMLPGVGGSISYDYRLIDSWGPGIFTIGGYIGYSRGDGYANPGSSGTIDFWESVKLFSLRATYRYDISKRFEIFGAIMPGLLLEKRYGKKDDSRFFIGTTAGCRFLLTNNISLFAETGYNVLCINGGISFSF